MAQYEVVYSDVLIVGGGISGMTAAIKMKDLNPKLDVLVIDKGIVGWAGQIPVSGGHVMTVFPGDDPSRFEEFAIREGKYLNNQHWTRKFLDNVGPSVRQTVDWGFPYFRGDDGDIIKMKKHDFYNITMCNPKPFMVKLRKIGELKGVRTMDRVPSLELIQAGDRVAGVMGYGMDDQKIYAFMAKEVVLASGSCRYKRMKTFTMNSGEGVGMAYEAGAELMNAEFSNSYGFVLKDYEANNRDAWYYYFVNAKGERIMEKHHPDMMEAIRAGGENQDFSKVVGAMGKEALAGNGPIYLDLTGVPDEEYNKYIKPEPLDLPFYQDPRKVIKLKGNADIRNGKYEMIPAFVAGQGPIRVDTDGHTTVPGLWAVGDVCSLGSGWFGARPSSACPGLGFPFAMTTGFIVAQGLVNRYGNVDHPAESTLSLGARADQILKPMQKDSGRDVFEAMYRIHEAVVPMKYNFFRNEEGLNEALDIVEDAAGMLAESKPENPHDLEKYYEVKGMIVNAKLTLTAAKTRKESRGVHRRLDYPEQNDAKFRKWIVQKKEGDQHIVRLDPVPLENYPYQPAE